MKIYIAGPMRGIPDCNRPAFRLAADRWAQQGYTVFTPTSLSDSIGLVEGAERHGIRHVLVCIDEADGVALLPGWEESVGVTLELAYAQFLGLKIFDALSMREIRPRKKPWELVRDYVENGLE